MGAMVKTPMTRTEACQILNIEEVGEGTEPVDYNEVLERFEVLFEKNSIENAGSFYLRSKIYFAKEHLMMDWPEDLNVSKFDGNGDGTVDAEAEAEAAPEETADNEKGKSTTTDSTKEDASDAKAGEKDPKHPNKQ